MLNALIIGAGIAGITAARLLADKGYNVEVIEKRDHIGGNVYDSVDGDILVHRYGPHIFHTNNSQVVAFLSQFCEFELYRHKVLGFIDGKLLPIPFNLTSIHEIFGRLYVADLIDEFGYGTRLKLSAIRQNRKFRDILEYIYEKVFLNYTLKQWGGNIDILNSEVIDRLPIVISEDDSYFTDTFQAMPVGGYVKMFSSMLFDKNISVTLGANALLMMELDFHRGQIFYKNEVFDGLVIYCGSIDELLEYKYGALPYRSLEFKNEHLQGTIFPVAVVNYPNDNDYTRVTEYKHFYESTRCLLETVITYEYPMDYNGRNIPYYPIPLSKNMEQYNKYLESLRPFKNLKLLGRLAEYKYLNMDEAVYSAIQMIGDIYNG